MAKKHHKKASKSNKYALSLTVAIFSVIVLVIGLTVVFAVRWQTFCANTISCAKDLSGKKTAENKGVFMGKKVASPQLPDKPQHTITNKKAVLGEANDRKHIYVSLDHQRLYAYENNNLKFNFPVSTGKWHPTPTGDFRIWVWLRYTRMSGGNPSFGTYYNLPNVPYTMYYANNVIPKALGYSLHGAYWHNNFGHPMSHGCVNLHPDDAAKIFYWTNPTGAYTAYANDKSPGTLITIYGKAPAAETAFID